MIVMMKQTSPSVISTSHIISTDDNNRPWQWVVYFNATKQTEKLLYMRTCARLLVDLIIFRWVKGSTPRTLRLTNCCCTNHWQKNTTRQRGSAYRWISDLQVKKLYLNHKSPCHSAIDCPHKTVVFQLFVENPCIYANHLLVRNNNN
jgi:hypothetical protein